LDDARYRPDIAEQAHQTVPLNQQRASFVKSLPHLRDRTRAHLELLSVHRRIGDMRQGHSTNLVHLLVKGVESIRADGGRLLKDGKIQSTALASDREGLSGDEKIYMASSK